MNDWGTLAETVVTASEVIAKSKLSLRTKVAAGLMIAGGAIIGAAAIPTGPIAPDALAAGGSLIASGLATVLLEVVKSVEGNAAAILPDYRVPLFGCGRSGKTTLAATLLAKKPVAPGEETDEFIVYSGDLPEELHDETKRRMLIADYRGQKPQDLNADTSRAAIRKLEPRQRAERILMGAFFGPRDSPLANLAALRKFLSYEKSAIATFTHKRVELLCCSELRSAS